MTRIKQVRPLLESCQEVIKCRMKDSGQHHAKQRAGKFIGEVQANIAAPVRTCRKCPRALQPSQRTIQAIEQDAAVLPVDGIADAYRFIEYAIGYGHFGDQYLICSAFCTGNDAVPCTESHEFGVALDVRNEREHLLGAVLNSSPCLNACHIYFALTGRMRLPVWPQHLRHT